MLSFLRAHPFRLYYSPADDPLHNFYIPALSASVCYDRSAGFFSSSALAVAAAGVARLIQNGGHMRLLVGAELSEQDVDHIQQGYDLKTRVTERLLARFPDPQEALLRQRLEVLAWMVAEGTLEIKVVLPRDRRGLPIPAQQAQDYYHPKSAIFTDADGDRVAFTGSVNESETAWTRNYEAFSVYTSWAEGQSYLPQVVLRFEQIWNAQDPDWIALDIPDAVRGRLLKYRPAQAPTRDPLERPEPEPEIRDDQPPYAGIPQAERLLFQFLRDAPYLPNAVRLGAETAAIKPWPHQTRVAQTLIERFPDRAMLCDEVGLGKTIEAGLILRQLVLSGRVKRALILAPKSVLKQWQEELYEKFALDVPRYDDRLFWDVRDQLLDAPAGNPWNAFDLMLAGSQLAKRADRRAEILQARPWDMVFVDEAHHARRKDFKERIYRPNRLLSLLSDFNAQNKTAGLILMTATPMQVHPLEVWDLLTVLGLGGRWGADEDNFLDFFAEMRKPFGEADWETIFTLVQDFLETGGQLNPAFKEQVVAEIGPVKWSMLADLPAKVGQRERFIRQLGPAVRPHVKELARRHTPLTRFVFRNTRALLREYRRRGLLMANVPTRRPELKRVKMRPEEEALYNRIEEYIGQFYQKYENERRGLGFVMTVYRRRLTSSFHAVRCSLERRLKFVRGQTGDLVDNDDLEQDDLEQDVLEENLADGPRERFRAELVYLEDFVQALRELSVADSKLEVLKDELSRVFRERTTAIVFTQYADTMDYLREQLATVYGTTVACYSGRGGEIWDGTLWLPAPKEAVKTDFRSGKLRLLLCTESASEGLNLQTCGVLINYDMPWNPMRVEQRIGRIDRIEQTYAEVWISNYFYRDTIEDVIYQRLADRINWFEVVVGDLQPILADVSETTRRLAMLAPSEREAQLDKEISALRARLQNREVESLNLDEYLSADNAMPDPASPVWLLDLESWLTTASVTKALFRPHPDLHQAFLLNWRGEELPVTFSPACFDAHPDTVRFLSYGSSLLKDLLDSVPAPDDAIAEGLVRYQESGELELRGWYRSAKFGTESQPRPVESFAELQDWLVRPQPAAARLEIEAQALFAGELDQLRQKQAEILKLRQRARHLADRSKAQRLLVKAALVELALGQQPEMFEPEAYPTAFDDQAVLNLQRHKFPWSALLNLAFEPGLNPKASDPYYQKIASERRETLKARLVQLKDDARKAVQILNDSKKRSVDS